MARSVRQSLPKPPPEYDQAYISQLADAVNRYMFQAQAPAEVIAAHFIMTDPLHIPPDIPNTHDQPTGLIYLRQISAMPLVTVQVGSPSSTSSTSWVMLGLNVQFTPPPGVTRATFTVTGQIGNTGNGETDLSLAYGTGTPPVFGAPATGTMIGLPVRYTGPSAGAFAPFSQTVAITGLTPGVTYWIGAAVKVSAASSVLNNLAITGQGVSDSPGYFLTVVEPGDLQ